VTFSLFSCFLHIPQQSRHPERSASQIYGLTQRFNGAESKDPGGAYLTEAVGIFSTTQAREQDSSFVTFLSSVVVCGRKAPKSICQQASPGSFDSAPSSPLFTVDPRSASLGMTAWLEALKYNWLDMQKHEKSEKVTGSPNDKEEGGRFQWE
jgi:hypothetical protein